jgi:hypothetical protein
MGTSAFGHGKIYTGESYLLQLAHLGASLPAGCLPLPDSYEALLASWVAQCQMMGFAEVVRAAGDESKGRSSSE